MKTIMAKKSQKSLLFFLSGALCLLCLPLVSKAESNASSLGALKVVKLKKGFNTFTGQKITTLENTPIRDIKIDGVNWVAIYIEKNNKGVFVIRGGNFAYSSCGQVESTSNNCNLDETSDVTIMDLKDAGYKINTVYIYAAQDVELKAVVKAAKFKCLDIDEDGNDLGVNYQSFDQDKEEFIKNSTVTIYEYDSEEGNYIILKGDNNFQDSMRNTVVNDYYCKKRFSDELNNLKGKNKTLIDKPGIQVSLEVLRGAQKTGTAVEEIDENGNKIKKTFDVYTLDKGARELKIKGLLKQSNSFEKNIFIAALGMKVGTEEGLIIKENSFSDDGFASGYSYLAYDPYYLGGKERWLHSRSADYYISYLEERIEVIEAELVGASTEEKNKLQSEKEKIERGLAEIKSEKDNVKLFETVWISTPSNLLKPGQSYQTEFTVLPRAGELKPGEYKVSILSSERTHEGAAYSENSIIIKVPGAEEEVKKEEKDSTREEEVQNYEEEVNPEEKNREETKKRKSSRRKRSHRR